jgi:thiol-disulfide isomerase/thioredoxin
MRTRRLLAWLACLCTVCSCCGAWGAQRVVLLESFTNTGCGPCASANPVTHQFVEDYTDLLVLNLQYHVNWPSATDPFYLANTTDNLGRRTYYGISAVPDLITDGVNRPNPGSYEGLVNAVGQQLGKPAPFTIDVSTTVVGTSITVDADVTAVADVPGSGLKLRIALVEPHVYTDPPGSDNGERDFYCIMRDMLPTHAGQDLTIANGQTVGFSESGTLDPAWTDVYAVVWVQDDTTKEVLQAASSLVNTSDYACFYGWHRPTVVGAMLDLYSFHSMLSNVGGQGDTYDVAITYDHPANWSGNVCANGICYPPGTRNITVSVPAGEQREITVDITPIVDPGEGRLIVSCTSQGDPSLSWTKTFKVIAEITPLLLVDDDGGEAYDAYYTQAIDATGYVHGSWNLDSDGKVSGEVLDNFHCVVWNVGWSFPSLDADDRAALTQFLDNGGALFVSGQDIGWDYFDPSGSQYGTPQQAWFQTYLGATYVSDDSNDMTIVGIAGDPVGDGLAFSIAGGDGANNQQYPSEIQPYGTGVGCLEYAAGQEAAVRNASAPFKSVYFAFGFEGIATGADRALVMQRVLDWLDMDLVPVEDHRPVRPYLATAPLASPNPFNPQTAIRFEVGGQTPTPLRVDVYDLVGRRVRSLFRGEVRPGPQRLVWDGRADDGAAVASGLYVARVEVAGQTRNLKLTLTK